MLLLSRCTGALVPFLTDTSDPGPGRLRIGYIDDAQVASARAPFVQSERNSVWSLGHEVISVTAPQTSRADFDALLAELDAVYVASGSTFALLEALRASGNQEILIAHVSAGLPYIGSSAGSIVAGPDVTPASMMDDPADGPSLASFGGLALVEQTVIPHADGQLPPYPLEPIEATLERFGDDYPLLPLRDDQALLVDGASSSYRITLLKATYKLMRSLTDPASRPIAAWTQCGLRHGGSAVSVDCAG
jgi:dipeptidase E